MNEVKYNPMYTKVPEFNTYLSTGTSKLVSTYSDTNSQYSSNDTINELKDRITYLENQCQDYSVQIAELHTMVQLLNNMINSLMKDKKESNKELYLLNIE